MNPRKIILPFVLILLSLGVYSKVKLPHIISNNMVIQQQSKIKLWGWASPGKRITVKPSWVSSSIVTVSDAKGRWNVSIYTPQAGYTPLSITFSDGQPVTIGNILAGEVWVCAGQSNMEMPVNGFHECPVEAYDEAVASAAKARGIRYVKIPSQMRAVPQDDADCRWLDVDANTVNNCSAVGYFFARRLQSTLNIPVGLVLANKGGTRVESWLDENSLKQSTTEPTDSVEIARRYPTEWLRPLLWGNATFHPIRNYTVKGILYYQGCSNVGPDSKQYARRLETLANQWRRYFGNARLPFYFVQIAPHAYGDAVGTAASILREQQYQASMQIPHSSLVCTNDLVYSYEQNQIHPCQKKQVGERLATTAIARDYGFNEVMYKSAAFDKLVIRKDSCIVHLKDTYHGITCCPTFEGFEIAGADRIFHPARARYTNNDTFVLTSPDVPQPVAVRYCFRNFLLGTVKNRAGLPLFPFRTDDW